MAYAQDATPPARRRVALRTVPPTPHYLAAEPVARLAAPAEEQSFLETLRKLWRHRLLIAACTLVLGGAAILAAWLMPSYYVSEARVLVGVQSPRLPNVESIVADVSPDAERVQNEGFILQSRNIAKQVIDQLKLRQDPEFNPELAPPSLWARLNPMQYLPTQLTAWVDRQTSSAKKVEPIKDPSNADDRTIDSLLSHIDVSTLGRSHVLERQGRIAQSADRVGHRQRARRALSRLPAPRQDRVDGPRRQVPDGPRHRAARCGAQVRPGRRGLPPHARPLQERRLGRRRHQPAAHRAQHPASRRPDRQGGGQFAAQGSPGDAQGRPQQRKRARSAALAPHHRAEAAAVRRRAQGRRAAGHLRPAPSLDAQCPLRSRQHPGQGRTPRSARSSTASPARRAPPTPATRPWPRTSRR